MKIKIRKEIIEAIESEEFEILILTTATKKYTIEGKLKRQSIVDSVN